MTLSIITHFTIVLLNNTFSPSILKLLELENANLSEKVYSLAAPYRPLYLGLLEGETALANRVPSIHIYIYLQVKLVARVDRE